ncbi:hypothetical protein QOZ80_3BG0257140 [Eleusine coracana subsp. coracana]|nr:hypothetical protein QOZ80_3BG0257140 [Eleusine coracana subsp. coracana]
MQKQKHAHQRDELIETRRSRRHRAAQGPMAPPLVVLLLTTSLALALCPVHSHGAAFSNPARVTQLSWSPRAFLYSGFLSDSECDHLVQLAKGRLEKTTVVDINSGESLMSQARTSTGTFLAKRQDEIVAGIEKRVAAWTFLPEENAEAMQILRYEIGQKYDAHYDYFRDKLNLRLGGHRIATVLMYLTDVKSGGETVFPDAMEGHLQHKDETWSDCAKAGLAVKPRKGDALLFFGLHLNATTDPSSLHGSCPVIEVKSKSNHVTTHQTRDKARDVLSRTRVTQKRGRRKRPRKNKALQGAGPSGTMRRPAGTARAAALAIFFGALVFMSLVIGDGKNPALLVIGGRRMMSRADGERKTLKDVKAQDPFQDSKRRVPNGPDPIHNRGTGKSGRSPGRA